MKWTVLTGIARINNIFIDRSIFVFSYSCKECQVSLVLCGVRSACRLMISLLYSSISSSSSSPAVVFVVFLLLFFLFFFFILLLLFFFLILGGSAVELGDLRIAGILGFLLFKEDVFQVVRPLLLIPPKQRLIVQIRRVNGLSNWIRPIHIEQAWLENLLIQVGSLLIEVGYQLLCSSKVEIQLHRLLWQPEQIVIVELQLGWVQLKLLLDQVLLVHRPLGISEVEAGWRLLLLLLLLPRELKRELLSGWLLHSLRLLLPG